MSDFKKFMDTVKDTNLWALWMLVEHNQEKAFDGRITHEFIRSKTGWSHDKCGMVIRKGVSKGHFVYRNNGRGGFLYRTDNKKAD